MKIQKNYLLIDGSNLRANLYYVISSVATMDQPALMSRSVSWLYAYTAPLSSYPLMSHYRKNLYILPLSGNTLELRIFLIYNNREPHILSLI